MSNPINPSTMTTKEQVRYCLDDNVHILPIVYGSIDSLEEIEQTVKQSILTKASSPKEMLNAPVSCVVHEDNFITTIKMIIIASKLQLQLGFFQLADSCKFYAFYSKEDFHNKTEWPDGVTFRTILWRAESVLRGDGVYDTVLNFIKQQNLSINGSVLKNDEISKALGDKTKSTDELSSKAFWNEIKKIVNHPSHMPVFVYDSARTTTHRFKDELISELERVKSNGFEYLAMFVVGLFDDDRAADFIKIAQENKLCVNYITLDSDKITNFYIFHENEKYIEFLKNHPDVVFKPLHWTMNNLKGTHDGNVHIVRKHSSEDPSQLKTTSLLTIDPVENTVKTEMKLFDGQLPHPMADVHRKMFESILKGYFEQVKNSKVGDFTKKIVITIES